jgi:DNA-binding transcriptional MerR regulator
MDEGVIMESTNGLNEFEAAKELGVSVHALRQWRFKGRGPAYCKLGRRVVYHSADLEAFRQAHRVQPGQAA